MLVLCFSRTLGMGFSYEEHSSFLFFLLCWHYVDGFQRPFSAPFLRCKYRSGAHLCQENRTSPVNPSVNVSVCLPGSVPFFFFFLPQAEDARQIKISSPVLNAGDLKAIQEVPGFETVTLATVYPLEKGPGGLQVHTRRSWGEGCRDRGKGRFVCVTYAYIHAYNPLARFLCVSVHTYVPVREVQSVHVGSLVRK